jgi:hypothetical protein
LVPLKDEGEREAKMKNEGYRRKDDEGRMTKEG